MAMIIGAEIRAEMIRRELAIKSMHGFLRYRFHQEKRKFIDNWHLGLMCEVQTAVIKRQELRVLYNVPFRSLKTETIEQSAPAWMILQEDSPRSSVLSVGADATLAEESSEKTRDIVGSQWFADLGADMGKEIRLDPEHRQRRDWKTVGGCERKALGVGGTVVGKGADHLVWGDILKPKEANSDIVRTRTCIWTGETFRSRLNDPKTGTITGIMQRLHELDPTGYLLEQAKNPAADQWLLIKIPMESPKAQIYSYGEFFYERKADELMHTARVDAKEIEALKVSLGINYSGQCNQDPRKMEGNTFKLAWVNWVDDAEMPKFKTVYQSIDVAVTEEDHEKGCYTVIKTWGKTTGGQFYLLDVCRVKVGSVNLVELILEQAEKWHPRILFGTKGVIEKTVLPFLRERMKQTGQRLRIEMVAERGGSKLERGQPFMDMARGGNLYLPKHARWVADWKLEMAAVPLGAYWDQWDAAAIFFQGLAMVKASDTIDETEADDRDESEGIAADKLRKAAGKAVIPNAKAREPSIDVLGSLRNGKRLTPTCDQYVGPVRRQIQAAIAQALEEGAHKLEVMAKAELERLDRRYRRALDELLPKS